MKLLGSLTSPYVRKVRICAHEKSLDLPFEVVDPHGKDSAVRAHNPLGKVPVLLRDDASTLFDSPVITRYLDTLAEPRLYPRETEALFEVLRFEALADGILDATVTRLLETRREEGLRSRATIEQEERRISRALLFIEDELRAGRFGASGALSMAELCLATAIEYVDFRYPHEWRDARPELATWFHGFRERASFDATVPPGFERL
jgi:glutathione S-transferase